ncbi:MAG TPA: precorrin-4 C(11)-methyltransferase [Gemmataceae bacterium]|nr:precorrin-4 C(11)-methyltransferase [Gemmataceae bacterium]
MKSSPTIALIAVTRRGLEQARSLRTRLRSGEIHRPAHLGDKAHTWEFLFTGALSEQIPDLFARCDQLVFFLAAGAVVRLIAPCLVSKTSDPGVLAVDEAGRFVIPLLSGHQGGANAFARTVAGCLGATPVITTASDVFGGLSIDELTDTFGWIAEPAERLKLTAAVLVNREEIAILQEIGSRGCWLDETELPENVTFVNDVRRLQNQHFGRVLWITDRQVNDFHGLDEQRILWLRPPSLVLGVGCERGIFTEALADGLESFLQAHGVARASIRTLASVDLKADETALLELAKRHGWQTAFYPAEELAQVSGIRNPSPMVEQCVGTPGVAEPAALLAAGADRLLVEKQIVASPLSPRRMTFALARLASFQERTAAGRVIFAGAGPGDPELLTIKTRQALRRADVVIYAGSLVPEAVLRHAPATAVLHNSAPLTLEQVMEITMAAAGNGQCIVRLHSGDTSLYSAIQEQLAILEDAGIDCEVIPGISAFQATAAALKSELTLPEIVQTVILTRGEGLTKMPPSESLEALARHQATLCIFLSARLADTVQAQLLTAYPPQTPVAIAYRVTWPDEKILVTTLANLAGEVRRHRLTRTTLFLVGEAIGGRRNRSRLYDRSHGHLFRAKEHDETHPSA